MLGKSSRFIVYYFFFFLELLAFPCCRAFQVDRSAAGDRAVLGNHLAPSNINGTLVVQPQATSAVRLVPHTRQQKQKAEPQLCPLSLEPLILVSKEDQPILSERECQTLLRRNRDDPRHQKVLSKLQKRIDQLLGRSSDQEGIIQPRYLHYEPDVDVQISVTDTISSPHRLLPDGLHVDTNNGYWFRYLTVLVYLTSSNQHGATTFPLAKPLQHTPDDDTSLLTVEAAEYLLQQNIQHTRVESFDTKVRECQKRLLQSALDLYNNSNNGNTGIRLLPKAGHCAVFASITPEGTPDPRSWHAAEHVFDEKKNVLTFFYEIIVTQFDSQVEFGQECWRRYRRLRETMHSY